ncbi:glutamine amidotransferase-related protein [Parasphingorhabdus pacifica]
MSAAVKPRLALVGDQYNHEEPSHPRIEKLMPELGVAAEWVPTTDITGATDFSVFDGVWVVPGGPYRAQQGVHRAIRFARESGTPFLGTCGGFFSTVLEQAQNVLELPEVADLGDDLRPIEHVILPSACSTDTGHRVRLRVRPDSRLSTVYGQAEEVEELLQCQDGIVQEFMDRATQGGRVRFCAWDPTGSPRASEISDHPFFVGCLFQPELSSTADAVHPILAAFLDEVRGVARTRETGSAWNRGVPR